MAWRRGHPAEHEVLDLANQVDIELEPYEAKTLLRTGEYQRHTGLYPGVHFRKAVGEGCLHLRVNGSRAWLHWDRWDPRRYPLQHFFETPALWGGSLVAVAGTLIFAAVVSEER